MLDGNGMGLSLQLEPQFNLPGWHSIDGKAWDSLPWCIYSNLLHWVFWRVHFKAWQKLVGENNNRIHVLNILKRCKRSEFLIISFYSHQGGKKSHLYVWILKCKQALWPLVFPCYLFLIMKANEKRKASVKHASTFRTWSIHLREKRPAASPHPRAQKGNTLQIRLNLNSLYCTPILTLLSLPRERKRQYVGFRI